MRKVIPALILAGALIIGPGRAAAAEGQANCVGDWANTNAGPGFGQIMSGWADAPGTDIEPGRAAGYWPTRPLQGTIGPAASGDNCLNRFPTPPATS